MAIELITNDADDLLSVYIDRSNPAAPVFFSWDDGNDQPTPFQTADMPTDDTQAWLMVERYASGC